MEWLSGRDNCGTYPDGEKMQPSWGCWLFLGLYVILCVGDLVAALIGVFKDDNIRNWRYVLKLVIGIIIAMLNSYILWSHCTLCNGWTGLGMVILVGLLSGSVSIALDATA